MNVGLHISHSAFLVKVPSFYYFSREFTNFWTIEGYVEITRNVHGFLLHSLPSWEKNSEHRLSPRSRAPASHTFPSETQTASPCWCWIVSFKLPNQLSLAELRLIVATEMQTKRCASISRLLEILLDITYPYLSYFTHTHTHTYKIITDSCCCMAETNSTR